MPDAAPFLSVVSPVYKAEENVDELVSRISTELSALTDNYEIILVEDGSPDASWKKIEENCAKEARVKGLKLSRNFGQHSAITAGLQASMGEYVVVMDCDLQDNPIYIRAMLEKAREGYEIIFTRRSKREYTLLKNIFARLYFVVFNWLTETQSATANVGAFSMLSRKVVNEFCRIRDAQRHYLMILRWLGFPYAFVEVKHEPRIRGKSSYTLGRLIAHAVNGITSQSDKLLRLSVTIGLLYFCVSVAAIIYLVAMYLLHGFKEGWASTIVLLLLSTGLILMAIGVAGIYIGKIFEQVKERPLYLIDKKINF